MRRKLGLWPLALPIALAACASEGGRADYALVVQGKYDAHRCPDILTAHASQSRRVAQLQGLTERARQDAGGGLIAATVYGPELASARAELRLLERARIEKGCHEGPALPPPQPER